jgi:ankyrin repeat protein
VNPEQRSVVIPVCFLVVLLAFAAQGFASSEALIAAIVAGDLSRVQKLLEEGASPDSRNGNGIPALALAAGMRNAAIVKALLSKGADVHATTNNAAAKMIEVPVVWQAAGWGSAETLRLILQAGANPNVHDGEGITPLMIAALLGNTETIPVLIEAKADLKARDLKEQTALMGAANSGHYEAARLLLDAGAEVDALGELNATPLMYAAQHGFDDVVALLAERGADLNKKATPGLTALDLAKQNKQTMTIGLLENGGRQRPPDPGFEVLRAILYPEFPLEAGFLHDVAKEKKIEAARQLAVKGELQGARDILETAREELQGQSSYWWALAYLQLRLGDRAAALASFRKILAAPKVTSREALRVWKLMRDLGEAPPSGLSRQVLGVVVEKGLGPFVLVVAAFADGQPRFFSSVGSGVVGERWTDAEQQKDREIVRLAQELVAGMAPMQERELPKPGRVRLTVLTPDGSYGTEDSFSFLPKRYQKVYEASDQLFSMLDKRYREKLDKK